MFLEMFETFDSAYWFLCHQVRLGGFWCTPRGEPCQEVRPCSFGISDPRRALYTGVERRMNYRFFATEACCYVSGRGDPEAAEALCLTNGNMKRFINPETGTFDGFYGPRLRAGLQDAYAQLRASPWTRQACASVWGNAERKDTADVPCTLSLQFVCVPGDDEQPTLDLVVTMRSNDLDWGTPYDVAAFCEIQCLMASVLGYGIGRYWHNAGSLHLYRDHQPKVDRPTQHVLLGEDQLCTTFAGTNLTSWGAVSDHAKWFLDVVRDEMRHGYRFGSTRARRENGPPQDPWLDRLYRMCEFSWRSSG